MTLDPLLAFFDSHKRSLAAIMQLLLAGLVIFGVVTGRFGIAVTGAIALGVTLLPVLLEREFGYSLNPGLVLLLTLSVTIHTAGSLGLYEQFGWYDNIAHAVSAMVIAGIGYASFRALELHSADIDVPSEFRVVFILVFVLAAGVFWEVLEFALGDLVTVYGIDDIVTDMIFNTVGAIIFTVWGTEYVAGLTGFIRERFRAS